MHNIISNKTCEVGPDNSAMTGIARDTLTVGNSPPDLLRNRMWLTRIHVRGREHRPVNRNRLSVDGGPARAFGWSPEEPVRDLPDYFVTGSAQVNDVEKKRLGALLELGLQVEVVALDLPVPTKLEGTFRELPILGRMPSRIVLVAKDSLLLVARVAATRHLRLQEHKESGTSCASPGVHPFEVLEIRGHNPIEIVLFSGIEWLHRV